MNVIYEKEIYTKEMNIIYEKRDKFIRTLELFKDVISKNEYNKYFYILDNLYFNDSVEDFICNLDFENNKELLNDIEKISINSKILYEKN